MPGVPRVSSWAFGTKRDPSHGHFGDPVVLHRKDVVCEIQVDKMIVFRPVDASPNACSSSPHDEVEGNEAEEWGQDASLSDPSHNLEEVCVAIFGLDAAARA